MINKVEIKDKIKKIKKMLIKCYRYRKKLMKKLKIQNNNYKIN